MISEHLQAKIKKLLSMAELGTGNEAEVAMIKTRELMQAHGVTQDDVNLYTKDIPAAKRKEKWLCLLTELCSAFSGVGCLVMRNMFCLVGDEIGVNVGYEMYVYLKNEIERRAKKEGIKGRKLKNDFRIGCVIALREKFEKLGGWRDMLEKRKRVRETHFKNIKTYHGNVRYVNSDYLDAGKESGADININRQAGVNANAGFISSGGNV